MSSPSIVTFTPSAADPNRFRIDIKFDNRRGDATQFLAYLTKSDGKPGFAKLDGYKLSNSPAAPSMVFFHVKNLDDLTGLDPDLDYFLIGVPP